jgi:TolB protein
VLRLRLTFEEREEPMLHVRFTVVAAVVALAASLGVAAADATYHGKNGRIAFRRYFDNDHHLSAIFTINPDGTGLRQLTKPSKKWTDDQPDWSPDGSLLAFTRCFADGPCAVYTIQADGTGLKRLSPPCPSGAKPGTCEDNGDVTFLPDGKHLAFGHGWGKVKHWKNWDQIQNSDLVVSDLNGGHRRVLLRSGDYAGDLDFAYFSPDGKRFVYARVNSPLTKPALHHALFVASSDGADDHRITPWALDAGDNPDWSPDGNWILFRTHEDADKNSNIAIIHPDGSGFRQLTHFTGAVNMRSATFSPDGRSVVFASDLAKGGNPHVHTMRLDGTGIQLVASTKLWDSAVDWGSG